LKDQESPTEEPVVDSQDGGNMSNHAYPHEMQNIPEPNDQIQSSREMHHDPDEIDLFLGTLLNKEQS
jgi:hypothetical protein